MFTHSSTPDTADRKAIIKQIYLFHTRNENIVCRDRQSDDFVCELLTERNALPAVLLFNKKQIAKKKRILATKLTAVR